MTERRIDGTYDITSISWSPNSRTIAFFADGKLKKVEIGGGPVQVICNCTQGFSGTWNRDGVILMGSLSNKGIQRVSASGGEVADVLPFDESRKEARHVFPRFLPDGRHFLYQSRNSNSTEIPEIFVASIDGKERKPLFKSSSDVAYIAPGYLLFARDTTLMAQPDLVVPNSL